ncbi:MAG: polysaccharide deacetylase family protein [Candidatus Sulfotelmatobacter sp.]|jgi:peptidoglycan/xylan/chitin deacetylase (PgdA/CDA1 family)
MDFRSQARALLIQSAGLFRADALGFYIQSLKRRPHGLVVAMHETPLSFEGQFRLQLEWASQHFAITDLKGFAQLWEPNREADRVSAKPPLLFTFDDGRESNYAVAAPLLEVFGGRGVFFVVPDFAECAGSDRAFSFYHTKIHPDSRPGDEKWDDWKPMNPVQIADLAARGHAIGNHSLTHERLIGLPPEKLEREIGDSARKLISWTKKPVDAFAWTFGWDAIDVNAWEAIRRYHRFCFSPCAGMIDSRCDQPSLLWRREIEARYSAVESRFSYSGLLDLWWGNRRRRLRKSLRVSPC